MRTTLIALALFAIALPTTAAAKPHPNTALHRQQVRYAHADGYLKAIGHVARRTIYNPNRAVRRRWQAATRWLVSIRADARAKIAALTAPPRPPHYGLWMCIHGDHAYRHARGGEGAWYATNPNGHYNGLQMTYGWGELDGNPNSYTPLQIMWAAEHEAMRHLENGKIASWWLTQQWGQTIGPCWGYA